MDDFALVTEGVTDYVVLKNILLGYFKNQREPAINREQPNPQIDNAPGGWTLVMKYLKDKKFQQALQLNQYLIIQVDTDVSEESGFDVHHHDKNGPLPLATLVKRVICRLRKEIGKPDLKTYDGRLIFAVGVDEMECWLLPLWYSDAKAKKVTGCLQTLGRCENLRKELDRKNLPWISENAKRVPSYEVASCDFRKPNILHTKGRENPSLALFLDDLDRRNVILQAEK